MMKQEAPIVDRVRARVQTFRSRVKARVQEIRKRLRGTQVTAGLPTETKTQTIIEDIRKRIKERKILPRPGASTEVREEEVPPKKGVHY